MLDYFNSRVTRCNYGMILMKICSYSLLTLLMITEKEIKKGLYKL